ncbi:MAG: B12-binding domain-containing radical SAM protein [Magnetococcales bacterium]|nr:B12-binding domain-containing radical SAM protein [Magnetococcales bacterium]
MPMNIVLYYPRLGMTGSLATHLPLSLLYAGIGAIRERFELRIVDARLHPRQWQERLASRIDSETILVGISVMSGTPITNAIEVSRWCKSHVPHVPVVWGGPHATFNGREILLDEPAVDFSISGYGSQPLADLCKHLRRDPDARPLAEIPGLNYREGGGIRVVPPEQKFEWTDYRSIPYDLIEHDLHRYGQFSNAERVFSMYSAMGCPYQCTFCSSPAQYKGIRRKYEIYSPEDVVDHIEWVHRRYGATYIYFIDDDSFVRLSHVEKIIDEIHRRNLRVKLGFRGARINEIKKMSDEFLQKLVAVGTDIMHIGAESGSQQTLDLIKKNCTVEDIIEVNRKLARHSNLKSGYNWIMGLPGETIEDAHATRNLMLRIVADNPSAMIFPPNLFRPLPHTELYALAIQHGYRPPIRARDWAEVENSVEAKPSDRLPWCSPALIRQIEMLQICSNFIDDKIFRVDLGNTFKFRTLRFLARIYTPLAKLRMHTGYSGLLFEKTLLRILSKLGWG